MGIQDLPGFELMSVQDLMRDFYHPCGYEVEQGYDGSTQKNVFIASGSPPVPRQTTQEGKEERDDMIHARSQ